MHHVAISLLVASAVAGAEPFTFRKAIDRALTANPRRKLSEARLAGARAEVEQARAGALPTLDVGGSHVWLQSAPFETAGVRGSLSSTLGTATINVPLIEPRAWAHWAEATEDVEVAEENTRDVRRQLALAAGRIWTQVSLSKHVLAAREEALRTAQAHLDYVDGRRAQGATDEVAVARARQEQETAAALVERARAHLVRAEEALGVTLGLDGPADIDETDAALPNDAAWADERSDVREAELALRARHTETRLGFVDYLPSVSFVAQGFLQDKPTPTLPVTGVGYIAQFVVKVPIYDGGRRSGAQHQREAAELVARAALENLRRTSEAELRSGEEAARRARDALRLTTDAAGSAHRALELTEERFHRGVGTDLDVIDALREARDADIAVAVAGDELLTAELDVLAATGQLVSLP